MAKNVKKFASPAEKIEIVVGTYWPTRVIKDITIKDLTSDSSFRDVVTLDAGQAKYLYEQLKTLYGEQGEIKDAQN